MEIRKANIDFFVVFVMREYRNELCDCVRLKEEQRG